MHDLVLAHVKQLAEHAKAHINFKYNFLIHHLCILSLASKLTDHFIC